MRQIISFIAILLFFPAVCFGQMDFREQKTEELVTYEKAILLSGLDESLAEMTLATHFPDMRDMYELGRSPQEVCENLAKKGVKCWLNPPVPLIETGFTLGQFCQGIFNRKRRCLFKEPLELRILPPDKDAPYMAFFFEKLNDNILVVKELRSSQGHVSNGQEAGTAIRWLYSPSF